MPAAEIVRPPNQMPAAEIVRLPNQMPTAEQQNLDYHWLHSCELERVKCQPLKRSRLYYWPVKRDLTRKKMTFSCPEKLMSKRISSDKR
uniref:Uncharacterized protein n=1 Tax=Arundo donax TaxID=35708 RepID=A0A0A9GIF4_ARUDO